MQALLTLFIAASGAISAAETPPVCQLSSLTPPAIVLSEAAEAPDLSTTDSKALRSISLREPVGTTDQFLYAALIDRNAQQAWIYQYGGFSGTYKWYGPYKVDVTHFENCPRAKAYMPLNVVVQTKS
ncbi:hypothetical protein [Undibacterium crateris]|uniref:hypothetical protein n=1 Tax=Undibacterium crateris TaxID=2528175 RepID=UPI0013899715|nr:hypothetical protein [Undibacterium crateris]NDI84117.1 hypothetical protein [Undibacterium crateris]